MHTGELIASLSKENACLWGVGYPFDECYPYYRLAKKLEITLDAFFKVSREEFLDQLDKGLPSKSAKYLCFDTAKLDNTAIPHLNTLFRGFLGVKGESSEAVARPRDWEWERIDKVKGKYREKWGPALNINRVRRIKDFWCMVRSCDPMCEKSSISDHTGIDLLDLVAACSGYEDLEDFLDKEFGPGYIAKEDADLQKFINEMPDDRRIRPIVRQRYRGAHKVKREPLDARPELLTLLPHDCDPFYESGEQRQLIEEKLFDKDKLILSGTRGIGKTALAAKYFLKADRSRYYTKMGWIYCGTGIITGLVDQMDGWKEDRNGRKTDRKIVQNRLRDLDESGDKALLVLDHVATWEDLVSFKMDYGWLKTHILVTTYLTNRSNGWDTHEVNALSLESARKLFFKNYRINSGESSFDESQLIDRILDGVFYNPLLIELVSIYFMHRKEGENSGIADSLDKLNGKALSFTDSGAKLETGYLRRIDKEGKAAPKIEEIINVLYDADKVEKHSKVLVSVALLPKTSYSAESLRDLINPKDWKAFEKELKRVCALGWIFCDSHGHYCMNSVLKERVFARRQNNIWCDGVELLKNIARKSRAVKDSEYSILLFRFISRLKDAGGEYNLRFARKLHEFL